MTDEAQTGAPEASAQPDTSIITSRFADEQTELSPLEAFRAINGRGDAPVPTRGNVADQHATPSAEDDAGAAQNTGAEPDPAVAGDQQPSGDDTGTNDAGDDLPPIAPPRSWTKEEKAAFAALPREHQQTIAERERARHADVDRRLNEISRQEQASKTAQQAAEQARQEYEKRLPLVAQAINARVEEVQQRIQAEFKDITSWDDLERMSTEDPVRYSRWNSLKDRLTAEQGRANAVNDEIVQAQQRWQHEAFNSARQFYEAETKRFHEKVPEYADPKKSAELRTESLNTLIDKFGFTPDEINTAWTTGGAIPVHDHRFQWMVAELARLSKAEKTAKTIRPTPTPAPQVQRPAPAVTSKDARSEYVQKLEAKLNRSGSRRDALALMKAGRR